MDHINEKSYYTLFERMIDSMTDPEHFSRDEFVGILCDICRLFDLSKGVTEFYEGIWAEKIGSGEVMIDYDDGRKGEVVLAKRYITPSSTVIKGTLYRPADSWPLSTDEIKKLDIIIRALLSFVSRNRLQSVVEKIAFYDESGYPNIRNFSRYLDKANEAGTLHGNTLIIYNLRNFTLVNRDLGKDVGDTIIRGFYDHMKTVIDQNGHICRLGGDNFICIVKKEYTSEVLETLKGHPIVYGNDDARIMISACAGVYEIPDDYDFVRPNELIGPVYSAMLEAKTETDETIVHVTQKHSSDKEKIQRIRSVFPDSLAKNEFKAFYQPKVDINSGNTVGAEALCRWKRKNSFILPGDFIPVLEQNKDICRLDFKMLETVCHDIRKWLDDEKPAPRVSVNLSRKHLLDVDLVENLVKIIDEEKIPHHLIEFEFTETTSDTGMLHLRRIVDELHAYGIAVAVDDFGMGYSSLNLIREIKWDVLKLDKDFLPDDDEPENSVTSTMYRHVASMAHDIGLETVTEGVETKGQVETLRRNKCTIAQGFYFDKPMIADEFETRMSEGYYKSLC